MLAMLVMGSASIFGWILTSQQVPLAVASAFAAISSQPWFFFFLVNIAHLVIGCVFEVTAVLTTRVRLLLPVYGCDEEKEGG